MKTARFAALVLTAAALTLGACAGNKAAEPSANAGMINQKCPIGGGAADANQTCEFGGKTVGFCCAGCKGKFQKMSDEQKQQVMAKLAK